VSTHRIAAVAAGSSRSAASSAILVELRVLLIAILVTSGCGTTEAAPGVQAPAPAATVDAPAAPEPSAGTTAPPAPLATQQPPAALVCLARHFVGKPVLRGAHWALQLPDGVDLTWDDAVVKTFDTKMEHPDLEDTLSIPYAGGAIAPVTTMDLDPGRIRNDVLFKATYGATAAAVQQSLVDVDFVGQVLKLHPRAAPALARVSAKLKQLVAQTPSLASFVTGELGGTFAWRPIANTTRMSVHSYGAAIDIVVAKSNYWEWEKGPAGQVVWKNQIPQAVVDAFEAEGFAWGGRWYHYDTMHFEYRPDLFDRACASAP
jgi:hypothetical protein